MKISCHNIIKTESYIGDDQFRIRIEDRKMTEELNFETEEIHLSIVEKTIIVILWLLVMVVGNLLLIGLIQFERLSGDPCKRRIVDQVSLSFIK